MFKSIYLAIADDHQLFRRGLSAILSNYPEFEIVCEAENGQQLLHMIPDCKPDIVLLDVRMPVMDGIETMIQLRQHFPEVKVIVLSVHDETEMILQMLKLGVAAYLPKTIEISELTQAIKGVYAKGRYFTDQVSEALAKSLISDQEKEVTPIPALLSRREIEVVRLMASQFTNQEIGNLLHLSVRTVEGHRKRIQDKIGAKNMAGIIVYAVKQGLID